MKKKAKNLTIMQFHIVNLEELVRDGNPSLADIEDIGHYAERINKRLQLAKEKREFDILATNFFIETAIQDITQIRYRISDIMATIGYIPANYWEIMVKADEHLCEAIHELCEAWNYNTPEMKLIRSVFPEYTSQ